MQLTERKARWIGIPLLSVFLSFLFCDSAWPSIGEFLKTSTFVIIFWQGVVSIVFAFRKVFPKVKQTAKRIVISIVTTILYIIVADYLMRSFFEYYFPELTWEIESLVLHNMKNISISFMVAMIYELSYFYHRWNQANIEAEKLKTQQTISQLESLKNQISPHFLFNSLNTLAAIIPENQEQAVKFTEKLSNVYRYILQFKDKELVDLETELDFIKSYVFLLEIRYPENLTVNYKIDEAAYDTKIAPLTLQILVENAIKHNVISKLDPLTIEIYTDSDHKIVVSNKLQIKTIAKNSTKMGLENIRKRYHYLTEKSVEIANTGSQFLVSVPLIHFDEEKEVMV